ncbi:MAG: hypothetical protein J7L34_07335 [Thermotogaceae bacterium]|nr:hypothetical protein [Thermotogaceae bacterium]
MIKGEWKVGQGGRLTITKEGKTLTIMYEPLFDEGFGNNVYSEFIFELDKILVEHRNNSWACRGHGMTDIWTLIIYPDSNPESENSRFEDEVILTRHFQTLRTDFVNAKTPDDLYALVRLLDYFTETPLVEVEKHEI